MAEEALILSMIQKLEPKKPCLVNYEVWEVGQGTHMRREVLGVLRMIVDILRDKKLGEGRRLNCFKSDLIEMARDLYLQKKTYEFSHEIRTIKSWIQEMKMRMLKLKNNRRKTESNMRSVHVGEGDDEDDDVVGLDEDVKVLLRDAILNEEIEFWTSLITGMVGVGKTTLARQVYNHPDVISQFDCRAWVRISSDFSHKEVLIQLIAQVVDSDELQIASLSEKMEHPGNLSLRGMLHKPLEGMRYLIVFDDLPEEMLMLYMLNALPRNDNGSRLLLTSPSQNIEARVDYIHRMKTLDSYKSWRLFLKTISCGNKFTSELKFPKHLESRGKEFLKQCDGLPLAIKDVGRQFAEKRLLGTEWEQLLESIDLGSTVEILEQSYQKLDKELKSCFMHLAFIKENTTFRSDKFEQILDGGRMVSGDLFEIECCVRGLPRESMIEIVEENLCGYIKTFRINAILHSLSRKKAQEKIGFEILRNSGNNRPSRNPRHRVIICSREKFNYSMNHGNKNLVSLFFHGGGYLEASPSYWNSFEKLRILDLEDFGIKVLPESISTLIELRYLGLRNNYIQELPHSLACLKKLEVLDIALNFLVDVPLIIWEMSSLLHLYISDMIFQKPPKIVALKNLLTLTYISFDNLTYEVSCLQMMTSLCTLGIVELDGNSDVSKLFVSLAKLEYLQHLILKGFRFKSMPCLDELGVLENVVILKLEGFLPRLPSSFPLKMSYLTLVNSRLNEDPMPILEKLTCLKYLKLRNAYTGQQMVILPDGFPNLQKLFIEDLWYLKNVQVGEGAMQKLSHLEIKNCPNLETLQRDVRPTTDVKALTVVTTKNIATKIRKSALISKMKLVEIKP